MERLQSQAWPGKLPLSLRFGLLDVERFGCVIEVESEILECVESVVVVMVMVMVIVMVMVVVVVVMMVMVMCCNRRRVLALSRRECEGCGGGRRPG